MAIHGTQRAKSVWGLAMVSQRLGRRERMACPSPLVQAATSMFHKGGSDDGLRVAEDNQHIRNILAFVDNCW